MLFAYTVACAYRGAGVLVEKDEEEVDVEVADTEVANRNERSETKSSRRRRFMI